MTDSPNQRIEEYIGQFSKEIQDRLRLIRDRIQALAPTATEKISYQMPTFYLNGNLVHYAAFKNHIGFYPTPSGITAFEEALKPYRGGKGSLIFLHNQPLPIDLIEQVVRYRIEENQQKQLAKKSR